jgi:hypothetical protein
MLHSSGIVASAKMWGLENTHQAIYNARDSPKRMNCSVLMNKAYGLFFFAEPLQALCMPLHYGTVVDTTA